MANPVEIARKIDRIATEQMIGMTATFRRENWPPQMQAIVYRAVAAKAEQLAIAADREAKSGARR